MSINLDILRIALPSIIANITTPLLGMVDLAIVGHLGSATFIAAIALGSTMFSTLYWLFGFLRMSTTGLTAQALGRNDTALRDAVLCRSMMLAALISLLLIVLSPLLQSAMLNFFGGDPAASLLAEKYFGILIFGAPAVLGVYALNGWFIGLQNTSYTLYTSLVVNVVNIAASLILVFALHLEIEGVACGSLIAQYSGLGMAIWLASKFKPVRTPLRTIFNAVALKRYFAINRDIFLRTVCLVAVTIWFTRAGARQGDIILAVNALLMQFFYLFSYFMDGFAFAGEALIGRLYGMAQSEVVTEEYRRTKHALFTHGALVALVFTIVYVFGGEWLLSVLTDDASVAVAAREFRFWVVTIPFISFSAFIWDGIFVGETRSRGMLISMAAATIIFLGVFFSAESLLPDGSLQLNHCLWIAFLLYLLTRGLAQWFIHRRL